MATYTTYESSPDDKGITVAAYTGAVVCACAIPAAIFSLAPLTATLALGAGVAISASNTFDDIITREREANYAECPADYTLPPKGTREEDGVMYGNGKVDFDEHHCLSPDAEMSAATVEF